MYNHLSANTKLNMKRISHIIGTEYSDFMGNTWVLDSCNDKGVPYFHKKGRKTLYTVRLWPHIDNLLPEFNK